MITPTTPEQLAALVTAHLAENPKEPLRIDGLREDLYRDYPAHNISALKAFAESPLRYHYEQQHPKKRTAAMGFGSIVHGLCLTPDAVSGMWVKKAYPDYRTKAAQEWRDAQTLIILSDEDLAEMTACAEAVLAHPRGGWIIEASQSKECAIFRRHEKTGLLLKARVDLPFLDERGERALGDIKKVQSIRPGLLSRDIGERAIHTQMAFYCMMDGASSAYLIAVEEAAPNDVRVVKIRDEALIRGTKLYEHWLDTLAKCLASNQWPGADAGGDLILELEEPVWAQRQTEEIAA